MKKVQGYPLPLGISITEHKINFSMVVKQGKKCKLLLYKSGEKEPKKMIEMPENEGIGAVRYLAIEKSEFQFQEYNYMIGDEIVVDPYAKAISGKEVWGEKAEVSKHEIRGKIYDLVFEWETDRPLQIPYHEVVAYNLHVRGYTKQSFSKVKAKGTFAGITEKIPYFQNLGINQIQCMPIYEFEECMRYINFWGYGPAFYFAPKASYAWSEDAVNELKEMVLACHKAKIEVVLDLPFYHDISTQIVAECLRYYVLNFHIDGFIINSELISMSSILSDPLLKSTKIMINNDNFQNVMRRFLKGDEGMVREVIGNLRHVSKEDGIYQYITSHNGFTLADLVSYDEKHNESNGEHNQDGQDYNYSWNCGIEGATRRKTIIELRKKQMKNAFFLLLMAQGTPCILAGDEFANSQKGNNNAYCQDNEIGWVDWRRFEKEKELFHFVKGLISFRKAHPVLHREEKMLGMDQMAYGIPDVSYHGKSAWQEPSEVASRQLGILYCGACANDDDCFIAYNMHWLAHTFALPTLAKGKKWYLVIDTSTGIEEESEPIKNQKEVELEARTIALFVGR